jgi:pyruvate formate lyase activating enzyme
VKIAALYKLSLVDYPGKISSVIFTQGCNFRCGYCHNPHLVLPSLFTPPLDENEIFNFLGSRIGKVQGVVITGGEPTIHTGLIPFIQKIKALGYLVKLDTNGALPDALEKVTDANILDFIAMDIKAPLEKYKEVCGVEADSQNIKRSIEIIKASGIPYQFRTTLINGIHTPEDVEYVRSLAGEDVILQYFKYTTNHINASFTSENEFQ